jgi:hypothetical protein
LGVVAHQLHALEAHQLPTKQVVWVNVCYRQLIMPVKCAIIYLFMQLQTLLALLLASVILLQHTFVEILTVIPIEG